MPTPRPSDLILACTNRKPPKIPAFPADQSTLALIELFKQAVVNLHQCIGNCLPKRIAGGADIVVRAITRSPRKLEALLADDLLCDLYGPKSPRLSILISSSMAYSHLSS